MTDERGLPVKLVLAGAGRHDLYACGSVYYSIPKKGLLICDRGYDAKWFRQKLTRSGRQVIIPKRQMKKGEAKWVRFPMLYKGRWICERTFSWLEKHRKLTTRYERHASHYETFWNLACCHLMFSAFTG